MTLRGITNTGNVGIIYFKSINMEIGTEVVFLDGTNERFGTIEHIKENTVHINGLDGTLYITNVQSILYPLVY